MLLSIFHNKPKQYFHRDLKRSKKKKQTNQKKKNQINKNLTETIIDTMLLRIASISDGSPSLKQISQTPIILCKSSSIPFGDFSSDISAPKALK